MLSENKAHWKIERSFQRIALSNATCDRIQILKGDTIFLSNARGSVPRLLKQSVKHCHFIDKLYWAPESEFYLLKFTKNTRSRNDGRLEDFDRSPANVPGQGPGEARTQVRGCCWCGWPRLLVAIGGKRTAGWDSLRTRMTSADTSCMCFRAKILRIAERDIPHGTMSACLVVSAPPETVWWRLQGSVDHLLTFWRDSPKQKLFSLRQKTHLWGLQGCCRVSELRGHISCQHTGRSW